MKRRGIILTLAAAAFALLVFHALRAVEPIEIVQARMERRNGGEVVVGRVRNNRQAVQNVRIAIRFYSRDGRKVEETYLDLGPLAQDAEKSFESPPAAVPGVEKFTVQVDRGRNPYGN